MKPFAKRRNVCKRKNKTSGRCVTAIIEADQVQLGSCRFQSDSIVTVRLTLCSQWSRSNLYPYFFLLNASRCTEPIYMYSLYYNALQREAGGGSS